MHLLRHSSVPVPNSPSSFRLEMPASRDQSQVAGFSAKRGRAGKISQVVASAQTLLQRLEAEEPPELAEALTVCGQASCTGLEAALLTILSDEKTSVPQKKKKLESALSTMRKQSTEYKIDIKQSLHERVYEDAMAMVLRTSSR